MKHTAPISQGKSPERHFPSGHRALESAIGRILLVSLLVAALSFSLDWVTESSLASDVIRHMAARLFIPIDAFVYGLDAGAADRDRLLVVDLGNSTLDRYHTAWPLTYGQHARMLERVRRARPKTLFVDFQFQSQREDASIEELLNSFCAFASDGIPVFLAGGADAEHATLRPEFEARRGAGGQPCFRKVAVGYKADSADKNVWSYPLLSHTGAGELPSAALALATAVRGRAIAVNPNDAQMGVVWGSSVESHGPMWHASVHAEPELSPSRANAAAPTKAPVEGAKDRHYCRAPSLWDLLPLLAAVRDSRPACPMHQSIEAASLTMPKTPSDNDALDAMIRDRAVLYGGSFDANEFISSPLHGELPGIYLHAQAVDNLLRFGDRWRHPEILGALGSNWERPMGFATFWVVSFILVGARHLMHRRSRRMRAMMKLLPRWAASRSSNVRRPKVEQFVRAIVTHVKTIAGRIGLFYAMLLLAVPLSLLLEYGFRISIIGYSSILGFCLLGEAFTRSSEITEAVAKTR